jgi:PAS domain S-box-containing protein
MKNVISRFEKAIQKVNLLYGVLLPISIGLIMGRSLALTNSEFFRTDPTANIIYLLVMVTGLGALILHLFLRGKSSRVMLAILYPSYSAGLGLLVLFIDPYPTPFYFQFIASVIAVDLVFGSRWQRATMVYLAIIYYGSYLKSTSEPSLEGSLVALTYIIGFVVVGILVSKYRQISDAERTQLKAATNQNAFERQRLLSLINNMGDSVVATDEDGKVLLYNAALLNLLDTNVSLEGQDVTKLLNIKDKSGKSIDVMKKVKAKATGFISSDYRHTFSDEDFVNLYMNVSSIKLGFKEKTQSGYIFIMRDITKEKSLEEERDEFISVISHELRTPIAAAEGNISNALFISEKEKSSKFVIDSLHQAHNQATFLASMINDLSTLSRAERADKTIEREKVDPRALVHSLQDTYKKDAKEKNLEFVASAAKNTKAIATSDLYLREILQNFITNSIKYTKKGSVVVHVRSNDKGDAIFTVSDTGIGLSKSDQKKVFEKFFRSEDFRTRESSGTGLGLYVTAKLAHKLGAIISLESTLNKGSTFTITVPSMKNTKK